MDKTYNKTRNIVVNNEIDINRNLDYKIFREEHVLNRDLVRSSVYSLIHIGKVLEREYNIRKYKECEKKESEIVLKYSQLEYEGLKKLYDEMNRLKRENVAMKKALKDCGISVVVE